MGACYSKSSHDAGSPRNDALKPKERKKSKISGRNGYPLLVVLDPNAVQKDISDTVYTEDSHTVLGLEIDNLVTKSQQTSLELMTKDPNKNIEILTGCDKPGYEMCNTDNSVSGDGSTCTCTTTNGVILSSDSGIVISETAQKINTRESPDSESDIKDSEVLMADSKKKCNSRPRTISGASVSNRPDSLPLLPRLQTVCMCSNSDLTCSSLDGTKTEHSCFNGESQGHFSFQGHFPYCQGIPCSRDHYVHRSSEALLLKSSLKKSNTKSRKKKGLSWKSADSLDWAGSTFTCLDRTKSEVGTIFNEDVNLLNAPLATFDSVDFALGSSYDFSKKLNQTKSCVNYSSDTFQFQFDFSELEGDSRTTTTESVEQLSDTVRNTESTTDLDKIKLAIRPSSVTTPTEQRSFNDSLEFATVFQQPEVTTMNMNGREVVVIDADMFTQIVDEIQFLKMKLSQLTQLIEDESPEINTVNMDQLLDISPT